MFTLLPDFGGAIAEATGTAPIHLWAIVHQPNIFPYESDGFVAITGIPQIFALDPPVAVVFRQHHLLTLEIPGNQVLAAMRFLRLLETKGATLYPRPDRRYDGSDGDIVVPLHLEAANCLTATH